MSLFLSSEPCFRYESFFICGVHADLNEMHQNVRETWIFCWYKATYILVVDLGSEPCRYVTLLLIYDVRPSVCPIYRPLHATVAGLLLSAWRAGNIDRYRCPPGVAAAWHTAANVSSVTLSAGVRSWSQTCFFGTAIKWHWWIEHLKVFVTFTLVFHLLSAQFSVLIRLIHFLVNNCYGIALQVYKKQTVTYFKIVCHPYDLLLVYSGSLDQVLDRLPFYTDWFSLLHILWFVVLNLCIDRLLFMKHKLGVSVLCGIFNRRLHKHQICGNMVQTCLKATTPYRSTGVQTHGWCHSVGNQMAEVTKPK